MTEAPELDANLAIVAPSELKTSSPFSSLFPIKPPILQTIRDSMARHGYDGSKPICAWRDRNLVIDGHTRRAAAIEAGVEVVVYFHDFEDEHAALQYAIASQKDRRNLTDADIRRCVNALDKIKPIGRPKNTPSLEGVSGESAEHTAAVIGTSRVKVEKLRTIEKHAPTEVKEAIDNGEMSINRGYHETQKRRGKSSPRTPRITHSAENPKPHHDHENDSQELPEAEDGFDQGDPKADHPQPTATQPRRESARPPAIQSPDDIDWGERTYQDKEAILRMFNSRPDEARDEFVLMLMSLTRTLRDHRPGIVVHTNMPLT